MWVTEKNGTEEYGGVDSPERAETRRRRWPFLVNNNRPPVFVSVVSKGFSLIVSPLFECFSRFFQIDCARQPGHNWRWGDGPKWGNKVS